MVVALTVLGIIALRLIDVSIGALRITYLVRGRRVLAGALGFFESLAWVIAAAIVLGSLDEWYKVAAYAAGFGLGTVLGGTLDRWIASGQVFVRVVAPADSPDIAASLREQGHGVTVLNGSGQSGDVTLTFSAMPRRALRSTLSLIDRSSPRAFVTVEDVTIRHGQVINSSRLFK